MNTTAKAKYTSTATTTDGDAIKINCTLNDVDNMIEVGKQLKLILEARFNNDNKSFNRWVKMNIDKDIKTIIRYMTLADNEDILVRMGIIRLSEAYTLLGIDGNINTNYNSIDCE